ncbi:DsbA family oxidoreductase [Marivibrio halodurans]|uniref:DsbA family oxidoreductase n=1 Tax=Marivibrio halodurans TaxID=2039722 RepID=A0A8J7RVU9_9PROT|nr:DsbA family oxidoreductase [Marivibrio halodurans]MBP5855485.1 DsbA family oxidoreductase [Marivibrio halodurans]
MQIDIFSDPICPWCFIGKKRLDAARKLRPGVSVTVRWRAFQLNPDMPSGGMDRQTYLNVKFGGPDRAHELYGHIRRVGEDVGIPFDFDSIPRTPNTLAAHRLIRHAQHIGSEVAERLVETLFDAYFLQARDIGDRAVLIERATAAGMAEEEARALLDGDDYADEIRAEDNYARRIGIGGVPCFIVNGKYALSGAQEPESFLPLFDMARQERIETEPQSSG